MFRHPSGYQVEAKEDQIGVVLRQLWAMWPTGQKVAALFPRSEDVVEDLVLLHRNGLIDLRWNDDSALAIDPEPLHQLELQRCGYRTTSYHVVEAA